MDAIKALSVQMENMSTKDDLKNAIAEAVEPIKNKMVVIEEHVGKSEIRIAKLEALFENKVQNKNNEWQLPQDVHELIQKMQKEIDYLHASPKDGKETETIENHKKTCSIWGVIQYDVGAGNKMVD